MGSQVNSDNEMNTDNVVHGNFEAPPPSPAGYQKEVPDKQEVHDNLKRGANQLPTIQCAPQSIVQSCMTFVNDVGLNPNVDIERKANMITDSVALRQQIASLRQELAGQLSELKRRSNRYIHVAESAGNWIVDAERFVDRHPNLLWFLKRRK